MAAPKGFLTGKDSTIHLGVFAKPEDPLTYAKIVANGQLVDDAVNQVNHVTDFSGLGSEGSSDSFQEYGKKQATKIAGTAEASDITCVIAAKQDDALHVKLLDKTWDVGQQLAVALHNVKGAGASVFYAIVEISGISIPTPASARYEISMTLAVQDGVYYAAKQ